MATGSSQSHPADTRGFASSCMNKRLYCHTLACRLDMELPMSKRPGRKNSSERKYIKLMQHNVDRQSSRSRNRIAFVPKISPLFHFVPCISILRRVLALAHLEYAFLLDPYIS